MQIANKYHAKCYAMSRFIKHILRQFFYIYGYQSLFLFLFFFYICNKNKFCAKLRECMQSKIRTIEDYTGLNGTIQDYATLYTGRIKKNARILWYHKNGYNLWTMPLNYKPFSSPENWDSWANFEYRTIFVWFQAAEIFEKQYGFQK